MLDYNILANKPTITVVKNNEYVTYKDLSTQIYKGINYDKGVFVLVEEYYIARPDLISLAIYGEDKYADILCKINGISNPFELNKDMIIFAPDIDAMSKICKGNVIGDDVLDEFKTLDFSKIKNDNKSKSNYTGNSSNTANGKSNTGGKTSGETIDRKKKNLQKYKNERRSPGDQTVSDKNYVIDKTLGIVIY